MCLQEPGPRSIANNSTLAFWAGACGVRLLNDSTLALTVGACTSLLPSSWSTLAVVLCFLHGLRLSQHATNTDVARSEVPNLLDSSYILR